MTRLPCRRRGPRGVSLFELLAAMTAASAVMAVAIGVVHRSFTAESRSRTGLADERTALRLARQLRADVHSGHIAACGDAAAGNPLLSITGPVGSVVYRQEDRRLVRIETSSAGAVSREDYCFARPPAWTATLDGRIVTLATASRPQAAAGIVVEAVAALGRLAPPTPPLPPAPQENSR